MRRAVRAIISNDNRFVVIKRNKFGNEYYTLPGGGIEIGEDAETALKREIKEETGMEIAAARFVYLEEAGDMYGPQYIYLCQVSGQMEPKLDPKSIEAILNEQGKNLYEPMWMKIADLPDIPFRSETLKQELIGAFKNGFPDEPKTFRTTTDIRYTKTD